MAEIDGGVLSFKSVMDNDQMNAMIDETLRSVQGLSDGTVAGGQKMDVAFDKTADGIRNALGEIGAACEMHEQALQNLEAEYQRLGQQAGAAFDGGNDNEYNRIKELQQGIQGEITARKQLLKEARDYSDALDIKAAKLEENRRKTEDNTKAQVSFRTQLKMVQEEMKLMIKNAHDNGIVLDETTGRYAELKIELGRLTDIQKDVQQQASILSNDEAGFQGIIQGLSGLAGGFSAVTGTVSLFAGENEDLQKVMTKVQSVMAITIGLQQVAQTLNKDSAFQLVTLNGLKEWWAGIVAKATVAETAETIATTANTAAQTANATATGAATASQAANTVVTGGQAVAAKVGTIANIGLAGAFRLVGVAIKSIPVFGWILAGISALVGLVAVLTSESRKAAKETKEMNAAIVEGSYKAIGSVQNLSSQWAALGDNLDAKKKFIEQNKKEFDELGVSIRDVADAEKLLADGAQAFIDAQIAKAKAAAVLANSEKWVKQSVEADLELEQAKKKPKVTRYVSGGQFGGGYSYEIDNPAIQKALDKQKEANEKLQGLYADAAKYTADGLKKMEDAGIDGQDKITEGTVAWYEKQISDKQTHLKTLSVLDNAEIKATQKQIADYQKIIDDATGKKTAGGSSDSKKDPFLEKLEKQKKEYTRFQKWMNSGDDVLSKAATTEFDGLLKQGATYIDYLKKQREIILSVDVANRSKAQNQRLRTLNDQISEETKKTVLESFNTELSEQLNNAKTTLEILNIISQKRKELANDGTDVDNGKKDTLDEAEKDAIQKQKKEIDTLLDNYSEYLNRKIGRDLEFENKMASLRQRAAKAETEDERKKIISIVALYEQMHALNIENFEELEQINADSIYRLGSFEQKRLIIVKDYEKLIGAARIAGQEDVAKKLEGERDLEILRETQQYKEFFGDVSEVSLKTLENTRKALLSMMQAALKAGKITADEYKLLIDEINNKMDFASKTRGIEALFGNSKGGGVMNMMFGEGDFESKINSFKTIFKGSKKDMKDIADDSGKVAENAGEAAEGLEGAAGGAAGIIDMVYAVVKAVSQTIDAVTGVMDSISAYKESMGEDTDALDEFTVSLKAINDGLMGIVESLKSGDIMGALGGVVSWIIDMVTVFNTIHDKRIEKSIQGHARNIKDLQASYEELERVVDRALGGDRYSSQKNAIGNLKQQQAELSAQADEERSKKKSDPDKIHELDKAVKDNANQIADIVDGMRKDILGLDAASAAEQLGSAFIDAFSRGEDAAAAWGDKVDDIVGNIMQKMLIQKLLEQPMGKILDKYSKKWYDDNGNFAGFDTVISNAGKMGDEMKGLGSEFAAAMENLPDEIKKYFTGSTADADTTLTGAVKGVSEETASMVAGQMNAIRINQMEATSILRQQLMHLVTIAQNTSYNKHLESIDKKLDGLNGSDPLRSKGFS